MEGIDPNPDNYVAGGILNTSTVLVGCLVRLEPNKQTEVSLLMVCLIRCSLYMNREENLVRIEFNSCAKLWWSE